MARKPKSDAPKVTKRLRQRLVLNRWALGVMGVPLDEKRPLDRLRALIGGDEHRGIVEGHTRFCRAMQNVVDPSWLVNLTKDQLDAYDSNIVALTRQLFPHEKDRENFEWTWFQYLCLLLTEIYLDRYFADKAALCASLNESREEFNRTWEDDVPAFVPDELNKLAFQNATGSGKTHLMHANILQFRHYAKRAGLLGKIKSTILLTPSAGLSQQHVEKFPDHVFAAEQFQKDHLPVFAAGKIPVTVLDYHDFAKQGRDGQAKEGPNTVHPDQFERCNLVLVDEGHRGAKGGETGQWKSRRDELSEEGFSFEYSATFSQAIDGSADNALKNEYAKSILFDYSYGEFYKDGYGKEFRILNVESRAGEAPKKKGKSKQIDESEFPYLVGALLAFYQQVRFFDEHRAKLVPFNIERPLLVLVGASVTGGDSLSEGELSDVQELLAFFRDVLTKKDELTRLIQQFMGNEVVVASKDGVNAFEGTFDWLRTKHDTPEQLYDDLKRRVFGSTENTFKLTYVTASGEIRLSVGAAEKPFGIINVGSEGARKVAETCEERLKLTVERDQTGTEALFPKINKLEHVQVLIGSRKFTEGWDSWRVSTMGLLNLGKGEGTQVIQLFGRGVRLKGQRIRDSQGNEKGFSLKRSSRFNGQAKPPAHVQVAETLNVFGVHASYMATFREMLQNEGLDVTRKRTWELPVIEVFRDKGVYEKLKIPVVPKGERGFRDAVRIPLLAEYQSQRNRLVEIELNWFPQVETTTSKGVRPDTDAAHAPDKTRIPDEALAFLDWDKLYFGVQRLKYEVGHNIKVTPGDVQAVLSDAGWYRLLLPKQDHEFRFDRLGMWQEIAAQLLAKLFRKLYDDAKARYDAKNRKLVPLKEAIAEGGEYEGMFPTWLISMSEEAAEQQGEENLKMLEALIGAVNDGDLNKFKLPKFLEEALNERHLYRPLLVGKAGSITIAPVALNDHEKRLVLDVAKECGASGLLAKHEVYLLRNGSRGKGIGFAEAGNFYPDFLLWIVLKDRQHIVFLDPHGMHHEGLASSKVAFHKDIKAIERDLVAKAKENVHLHSFLLSTTEARANEPDWMRPMNDDELHSRGVVRMYATDYLKRVVGTVVSTEQVAS